MKFMNGYSWGMVLLFLLIGYFIGVYMPGPGARLRTAVGV
jgi:hypothetical protein